MAKSLLEVLRDVSLDPTEQAAFSADPSGYLAQYGYEDVPPDDLSEAFSLVADTLPPDVAQTVTESQVASQLGAGVPDEGLATNGAPTFGAGYDGAAPDPDPGAGVGFGEAADAAFGADTHFGEGVGDSDDDPGFGQGGDGGGTAAADDAAFDHDSGPSEHADDDFDSQFGADAGGIGQETSVDYDDFDSGGDFDTGSVADDGFDDDVDTDFGADDIGSF